LLAEDKKIFKEAIHWYWVAASLGNPKANYRLGRLYLYGFGVAPNAALAKKYLRISEYQRVGMARRLLDANIARINVRTVQKKEEYSPSFNWWCGEWKDARPYCSSITLRIVGNGIKNINIIEHDPDDGERYDIINYRFYNGYLSVDAYVASTGKKMRQKVVLVSEKRLVMIVNGDFDHLVIMNKVEQ